MGAVTAAAPGELREIPLEAIDADALVRDRTGLDGEALVELRISIRRSGLRQPVEVFALAAPQGPHGFGLISGYRRLLAFREEHARGTAGFAAIPAFVRAPRGMAAALAAAVEENEVRAAVSPWGRGRIAVAARDAGAFATVEAAVDGLYPHAGAQRRARLRALARLAEAMQGALAAPDALSERQALRLARAVQGGHAPALRAALRGALAPAEAWRVLEPVLAALERGASEAGGRGREPAGARRATRAAPARLRIRRERIRDGWALRVTGPDATPALIEAAMARAAWLFGPA